MITKRKKIGVIMLLFCMALITYGCKNKQAEKQVEEKEIEESMIPEDFSLKPDTAVLAVEDVEVSYREVLFYIQQLKHNYENGFSNQLWSFHVSDNNTLDAYAKERIKKEIIQVKILNLVAKEKEYNLSEEEKVEAIEKANEYFKDITEEEQKKYDLTKEFVENIYQEHALANKVYDIVTAGVDTDIPTDEAKQITISYIAVLTNGMNKNNVEINMSQEEKKAAKKKVSTLLKGWKESENVTAFAEENTDEKNSLLTFGKENAPNDFSEEAFALKKGEFSSVIEKESGYYILYCVSDYDEQKTIEKKEEMIRKRQIEAFQKEYTSWSENYEIVASIPLWQKITLNQP